MMALTASSCPSLKSLKPQTLFKVARRGQRGRSSSSFTSITSLATDVAGAASTGNGLAAAGEATAEAGDGESGGTWEILWGPPSLLGGIRVCKADAGEKRLFSVGQLHLLLLFLLLLVISLMRGLLVPPLLLLLLLLGRRRVEFCSGDTGTRSPFCFFNGGAQEAAGPHPGAAGISAYAPVGLANLYCGFLRCC